MEKEKKKEYMFHEYMFSDSFCLIANQRQIYLPVGIKVGNAVGDAVGVSVGEAREMKVKNIINNRQVSIY